jgi:two-component system, sensor histidine kinase FlrB
MRGMGEAEGRIVLAEDVTDVIHRRTAAARNQRLAAMGEMAVQIVHQIRNPMGSIELFASMLRRDLAGQPEPAALAGKVQQGIKSLNLIIGNLLSFAKGAEPDVRPVDLQDLIEAAITELDGPIRQRGIRVAARVKAEAAVARVDPELWRQALLNLLDNAVQAMPGGGDLTVAASREAVDGGAAALRLTVADTGAGMSASVRERVFNPFFTTKERGAGLGLALVHNIVKAHGGAIEVESAEGQGSKFTITLPA